MKEQIKNSLMEAGFDLFGVASPEPFEEDRDRIRAWVKSGYAGEMEYLKQKVSKRCDPRAMLPGAASVVVAGAA